MTLTRRRRATINATVGTAIAATVNAAIRATVSTAHPPLRRLGRAHPHIGTAVGTAITHRSLFVRHAKFLSSPSPMTTGSMCL